MPEKSIGGKALIFSAPSGAGKTTIVRRLLSEIHQLSFSISATTRSPRANAELDGRDYYFLSQDQFRSKIAEGAFYEWEEVYPGLFYGTLKSEVDRIWKNGQHVVFDIDVVGGLNLKKIFAEDALSVFVKVDDLETLKTRLRGRNTESDQQLNVRIEKAWKEMQRANEFDYILVNKDLDVAVSEIREKILKFINEK